MGRRTLPELTKNQQKGRTKARVRKQTKEQQKYKFKKQNYICKKQTHPSHPSQESHIKNQKILQSKQKFQFIQKPVYLKIQEIREQNDQNLVMLQQKQKPQPQPQKNQNQQQQYQFQLDPYYYQARPIRKIPPEALYQEPRQQFNFFQYTGLNEQIGMQHQIQIQTRVKQSRATRLAQERIQQLTCKVAELKNSIKDNQYDIKQQKRLVQSYRDDIGQYKRQIKQKMQIQQFYHDIEIKHIKKEWKSQINAVAQQRQHYRQLYEKTNDQRFEMYNQKVEFERRYHQQMKQRYQEQLEQTQIQQRKYGQRFNQMQTKMRQYEIVIKANRYEKQNMQKQFAKKMLKYGEKIKTETIKQVTNELESIIRNRIIQQMKQLNSKK